MGKRNTFQARQARAKELVAEVAEGFTPVEEGSVGKVNEEAAAPAAQPGAIQFNIDQLFAALGAKDFEVSMLRAEVQKLQQQVATYKNIINRSGPQS